MTPLEFLEQALPTRLTNKSQSSTQTSDDSFWTTVTFAQSLDGKIAGTNGQQLILSRQNSMVMTHWMRSMHDTILVGINTVINDNPQLNTRHLPFREEGYPQPQPVILDTTLRLPTNCKLITNALEGRGKAPIVICGNQPPDHEFGARKAALEALGVKIIPVRSDVARRIPLQEVIAHLRMLGYRSLMIEGGQGVISHCLSQTSRSLINRIIMTIAPTFVGVHGTGVISEESENMDKLELVISGSLGPDIVAAYSMPISE